VSGCVPIPNPIQSQLVRFHSALEANTLLVFVTISSIAFDCVLGTCSLRFFTRSMVYDSLNSLGQ